TVIIENPGRCVRALTLCGLAFAIACESDLTNPGREAKPAFVRLEPGTVAQVSAGLWHTCALRTDGTVACWGSNVGPGEGFSGGYLGQATPPMGTFTQVSAGAWHTCGLRPDGTVACWGNNTQGQATPPAGTFTRVSAGGGGGVWGGEWATLAGSRPTAASPAGATTSSGRRRHRRPRSPR